MGVDPVEEARQRHRKAIVAARDAAGGYEVDYAVDMLERTEAEFEAAIRADERRLRPGVAGGGADDARDAPSARPRMLPVVSRGGQR